MAELGATDPLDLDKQKTKQPPNMAQAQDVLGAQGPLDRWKATDLGTVSPEERQRVIEYRSQPYMQQLKNLTQQQERYYEGQGLRFSTERREKSGQLVTEIGRQIGESVIVPQIERERGYAIQEKQLAQQADEFSKTYGLEKEKFSEAVRQYDTADDRQKKQWADELGLRRDELDQSVRQFQQQFSLEERRTTRQLEQEDRKINQVTDQFAQQLGLSRDQFNEAKVQYRMGRTDQLAQFAQQMGLSEKQLTETIREFDARSGLERERLGFEREQFTAQSDQFAKQFGLEGKRFEEAVRQFNAGNDLEVSKLAQEMGLRRSELDVRIDQFNRQLGQEAAEFDKTYDLNLRKFNTESSQWAAEHNLNTKQFQEAVRQFNLGNAQRVSEFAQQMGLDRDKLEENIKQFTAQLDLDTKVQRAVMTGMWEEEQTITSRILFGQDEPVGAERPDQNIAGKPRAVAAASPPVRADLGVAGQERTPPGGGQAASGPAVVPPRAGALPTRIGAASYDALAGAYKGGYLTTALEGAGYQIGSSEANNIRAFVASGGTDQASLQWLLQRGLIATPVGGQ